MIEDVYEPLSRYRDEFKEKFAALARAKFQQLTEKSGVDVRSNRILVAEIQKLQSLADSESGKKACFGFLMALGFVGAGIALIVALAKQDVDPQSARYWFVGMLAGVALGIAMIPLYNSAAEALNALNAKISAKKNIAWDQMAPLNRLYTWDVTVKLIESTVPRLEFDPYFTADRLASLHRQFGWDDSFNEGKSIIFAQSGVINGNPFVLGQYLDMEWGEKTYEGTKDISWTEWERGADGKKHRVTRYETLHAYVTKRAREFPAQRWPVRDSA